MSKPRLVLFDGNAIVHRAFHAFEKRPLTVSRTGEVVSAVYGFAMMLLSTINDLKPSHCAIAFDLPAPTFRHRMFAEYKAHRSPTPPGTDKPAGPGKTNGRDPSYPGLRA
ncbi:PIN domain-containing protein [Chloroflexota bacterium]